MTGVRIQVGPHGVRRLRVITLAKNPKRIHAVEFGEVEKLVTGLTQQVQVAEAQIPEIMQRLAKSSEEITTLTETLADALPLLCDYHQWELLRISAEEGPDAADEQCAPLDRFITKIKGLVGEVEEEDTDEQ